MKLTPRAFWLLLGAEVVAVSAALYGLFLLYQPSYSREIKIAILGSGATLITAFVLILLLRITWQRSGETSKGNPADEQT